MILTDVLTATDLNPMYYKFIPIFIKTWKKLFPEINIHIILIANEIIEELEPYKEYIKLFAPIEGIKSASIAQIIRLLYPALINAHGGILITDMDMGPMNREYYIQPIKDIENTNFVCYRNGSDIGPNEIPMCYCIAHKSVWGNLFSINNYTSITSFFQIYKSRFIEVSGIPGHIGWNYDQLYLYNKVQTLKKLNSVVILNDKITGMRRLDRSHLIYSNLTSDMIQCIKNHKYTDFHFPRPYNLHEKIINTVTNYL